MTAQCRWLNTVQSAQSGCPAGIWLTIKFPKTSPAWIALRSPICAVRCCPHFRQQTGRRIPSLSRFGRIREAGGTQIFVTTSPPAADGRRLFCHGHSSFQTPGRQGLSVQACCFRQQTDHAAQALCFLRFVRTVRGYNGGMAAPSSFDTAAFAVLTAANSQIFVGRSRRTAAPFPVPAWHTHKQLPRNIAKPSQWRHMALCVHFQFLLLLINGFHLCNTRKWGRNQPKRKSSGWFIQPELGKIGIHLFHLFRLNRVRAVRCRWILCFPGKPEERPVLCPRSRLQQMSAAKRRAGHLQA